MRTRDIVRLMGKEVHVRRVVRYTPEGMKSAELMKPRGGWVIGVRHGNPLVSFWPGQEPSEVRDGDFELVPIEGLVHKDGKWVQRRVAYPAPRKGKIVCH